MADDGNWWDSSSTRTRYESDQTGASSSSAIGSELVDPNLHLMAWNQTLMREKVNLSCVEQPYDGSSSSTRYGSDNSGVYGSADQDQQSAYQNYGSNNYNYDQLWRQPLQFSNNAPFWNASANDVVFSTQPPPPIFANHKPIITKQMNVGEMKKSGNSEAASKRPRNESPLPPFKVRKEKMGDRITALQQLVSPFGKTDTASVLSEAIEYIKFLHEQVTVLSTPYMKTGAPNPIQHHQDIVDPEEANDLRSRGLCLVPVSSTFPVTHETTVDFWTPSFGGSFR